MPYHAPTPDMLFTLRELAGLPDVLALPAYQELGDDLVAAVLEENARFAGEVLAPLNRTGDEQPPRWEQGKVTMPAGFKEAFGQFAQAGWQGLQHAQRWGGQGLPHVVAACANENINAANLAFALCPLLTDGVIEALSQVASPALQERYIPPLMQGRWTGTMNLTEPQAGSDLSLIKTRAEPQPDGSYRLTGQKIFITYGEHDLAENIVHLVLARAPDAPPGVKGISLFLVPKFLVNDDGTLGQRNDVWCASIEHKLGIHASPTAVMLYGSGQGEGGEGAVGYLVGQLHNGLAHMFVMMNAARFAVGLQGVALCERALQRAQAYAHERLQGQVGGATAPIVRHPDVQRMLLIMRGLAEGGRALACYAAACHDYAHHHPDAAQRAQNQALYDYLVPVVKGFATESAVEAASLGVQVHGGMGYIEETGAAQHYRDARILPIYEGTTGIQALDLLGRKTWRDEGAAASELVRRMRDTLEQLNQQAGSSSEEQAGLAVLARQFAAAVEAYDESVRYLSRPELRSQGGAGPLACVPYLMLAGTVLAGWQLVRAALSCLSAQPAQDFHQLKWATCVLYASHVLPRAQAYRQAVVESEVAVQYAGRLAG